MLQESERSSDYIVSRGKVRRPVSSLAVARVLLPSRTIRQPALRRQPLLSNGAEANSLDPVAPETPRHAGRQNAPLACTDRSTALYLRGTAHAIGWC